MSDLPRLILHNDDTERFANTLEAAFPGLQYRECNTYHELPGLIEAFQPQVMYSVRFNGTPGFPREAMFGSDSLKWISNGGAGTDHFGTWDPLRTTVTNSAGVAADMMAEYVIGGFLHFTLDVNGLQEDKASRTWKIRTVRPLNGKTLVIVGLGSTGQALAKRAKAFGMRVTGTRANPRPMENVDQVMSSGELSKLLPEADFIAVSTPLTDQTRGLLGDAAFATMKDGAILADVSRGGVIVQNALMDALTSGRLAAAVLDVFEVEPLPAENPLWALENVLISPHCSSVYDGWYAASFDMFLKNLRRWIEGKPLANVVDPEKGY